MDLLIIIGLILSNCSTIPNPLNNGRPEWVDSLTELNNTTDEINFVGLSYPTENLDDARYDALLNAGRTVISYLSNIKANSQREIVTERASNHLQCTYLRARVVCTHEYEMRCSKSDQI